MNREEWLTQYAERFLWPLLLEHGATKRKYRVSVGFPKGSRGALTAIGQCWPEQMSSDKTFEVFVSPILSVADAAHVLLHELVHVSDANKNGHKGPFKALATAVGLEGKMTATVPGAALKAKLAKWIEELGEYPHAPLVPQKRGEKGSRLLKAECEDCGFVFRTTHKWLESTGGELQCPNASCSGMVLVK